MACLSGLRHLTPGAGKLRGGLYGSQPIAGSCLNTCDTQIRRAANLKIRLHHHYGINTGGHGLFEPDTAWKTFQISLTIISLRVAAPYAELYTPTLSSLVENGRWSSAASQE